MSKLSPALKELINAPSARPGPTKAPAGIHAVYERIAREAKAHQLGYRPFLALTAATTITLNSPDALHALHQAATGPDPPYRAPPAPAAELIREVGLKCISFNGIPRTINCLAAFRQSLDPEVRDRLETRPSRSVTRGNFIHRLRGGLDLWRSVYTPYEDRLRARLADSHPDLPVHILWSHYALLLADPDPPPAAVFRSRQVMRRGLGLGLGRDGARDAEEEQKKTLGLPVGLDGVDTNANASTTRLARTGRVLTSLVAIACLRAQTGVGPQVLSHVFGLRKAVSQGYHGREAASPEEAGGMAWLAGDDGGEWLLRSVDAVSEALGGGGFAGGAGAAAAPAGSSTS